MPGYLPELPTARSGQSNILLVVGLGNSIRGDDSVGLELVRSLRSQREFEYKFLEASQPGLDLIELLDREGAILFLDAVVSGSPSGTIHVIPLPSRDVECRNIATLSSHGFGLTEIIDLRRALGRPMPKMMLLGIEIETVEPGLARSEKVDQAIGVVISEFAALLRLINAPDSGIWKDPHRFTAANFALSMRSEKELTSNQSCRTA